MQKSVVAPLDSIVDVRNVLQRELVCKDPHELKEQPDGRLPEKSGAPVNVQASKPIASVPIVGCSTTNSVPLQCDDVLAYKRNPEVLMTTRSGLPTFVQ